MSLGTFSGNQRQIDLPRPPLSSSPWSPLRLFPGCLGFIYEMPWTPRVTPMAYESAVFSASRHIRASGHLTTSKSIDENSYRTRQHAALLMPKKRTKPRKRSPFPGCACSHVEWLRIRIAVRNPRITTKRLGLVGQLPGVDRLNRRV